MTKDWQYYTAALGALTNDCSLPVAPREEVKGDLKKNERTEQTAHEGGLCGTASPAQRG